MVKKALLSSLTAAALLCMFGPARAQVRLSGSFTASQACPATQSIRGGANPGGVNVQPGQSYRVVGENRADPTHYLIVVEGAQPSQRWVAVGCGQLDGASAGGAAQAPTGGSGAATHVLALGWEPAFCKQHRDKAECSSMTASSADAQQLSLHGLWPQPRGKAYCGVDPALVTVDHDHQWDRLPEPQLSPATRQHLAAAMPGLESGLERHEWIVHGTCFGTSADAYFARAADLTDQVNQSPVRAVFANNIGATVSANAIRAAFDSGFGSGAGARVTVSCSGRGSSRGVSELVIALAGDVTGSASLASLIAAAPPVQPGCPSGLVQPAR